MIRIKTDDVELLKEVCETLAWKIACFNNTCAYMISDENKANILRCEGLEVEVIDNE